MNIRRFATGIVLNESTVPLSTGRIIILTTLLIVIDIITKFLFIQKQLNE